MSQLDKLTRSQRLAEHRDQVLEWLCEEPAPNLDEVARRLARISPRSAPTEQDGILAAKTYLKQLYRSLWDQGLIAANDFASLVRYARAGGVRPPGARELRPKNAYNLLRLIALATGWLRDGAPSFEVTGAFRDRLLEIKKGRIPLEDVLESLRPLVRRALSRRLHLHYRGFASSQLHEWEKTGGRSAKKLLYVLRTTLTGTHALRTGEIVTDVTVLLDDNGFGAARELVEQKRRGERTELPAEMIERWKGQVSRAFELLDAARERSPLPEEPPNARELEDWLLAVRRARFY